MKKGKRLALILIAALAMVIAFSATAFAIEDHTHVWKITPFSGLQDPSVGAICTGAGDCQYKDANHAVSLITPEDAVYNGAPFEAYLRDSDRVLEAEPPVDYGAGKQKNKKFHYSGTKVNGEEYNSYDAPRDAGAYEVAVRVYGSDGTPTYNSEKLTSSFAIERLEAYAPKASEDLEPYSGAPQLLFTPGEKGNLPNDIIFVYAITDNDTPPADSAYNYYSGLGDERYKTDAGTYYVWFKLYDKSPKAQGHRGMVDPNNYVIYGADGNPVDKNYIECTIDKADPVVEEPVGLTLQYNGRGQRLISEGKTQDYAPQMLYSLSKDSGFGGTVPTATDVNTYEVYYKVEESDNYFEVKASVFAQIYDGEITPPKGEKDLVYTNEKQGLLAEEAIPSEDLKNLGADITYAVSIFDEDADEQTVPPSDSDEWKKDIKWVRAEAAGTYCVWYKAVDSEGADMSTPEYILVSIAKAPVTFVWSDEELEYNGEPQSVSVKAEGKSWKEGSQYSVTGKEEVNAGTYVAEVTLLGKAAANYKIEAGSPHEWSINKCPVTLKWFIGDIEIKAEDDPLTAVTYNGEPYIIKAEVDGLVEGDKGLVTAKVIGKNYEIDHALTRYTTMVAISSEEGAEENYELPAIKDRLLEWNIAQATLTVSAVHEPITYGEPAPTTFAVKYDGLVEKDQTPRGNIKPDVVTGKFGFEVVKDGNEPRQPYKPGFNATGVGGNVYKIVVSEGSAKSNNYSFAFEENELTVNKRHVTFEWDTEDPDNIYEKTYDKEPLTATATTADIYDPYDDSKRVEVGYVTHTEEGDVETSNQATNVEDSKVIKAVIVNKVGYHKKDNYIVDEDSNAVATLKINPVSVYYEWTKDSGFVFNGKKQSLEGQFVDVLDGESLEPEFKDEVNEFYHAGDYTTTIIGAKAGDDTILSNYKFVKEDDPTEEVSEATPVVKNWRIHRMNLKLTWPEENSFKYTGDEIKYLPTLTPANAIDEITISYNPYDPKDASEMSGKEAKTYTAALKDYHVVDTDDVRKADEGDYKLVNEARKSVELPATHTWYIVTSGGGGGGGAVVDEVQKVIDMINALNPSSSDYLDKAAEAIKAYEALTPAQKADKRFTTDVMTKLEQAQQAIATEADKEAAAIVNDMIMNQLPDDPTKADPDVARATLAEYWALTDTQKALLSNEAKQRVAKYKYYYETQYAKAKTVKSFKVKNVKKQKARCTWKATEGVDGYKITYKAKGVKSKKVYASASATKKVLKKLKKGKKYTVKIRPYTEVFNPYTLDTEKVFGVTSAKKVKIKK